MTEPIDTPDVASDDVLVDVVAMRRRHLRQVVRIDAQSSGDRWSPGLFLAELRRGDGSRCYRVAMAGSRVVGFAGMLYAADDGHVTTVAVDEALLEADIENGLLNLRSPLARALIGKEEGDSVDVKTPGGTRSYEILSIRYI